MKKTALPHRDQVRFEIQEILDSALFLCRISHSDYSDRSLNLSNSNLPLGQLLRLKDNLVNEFKAH